MIDLIKSTHLYYSKSVCTKKLINKRLIKRKKKECTSLKRENLIKGKDEV